jgi:hypothetical protein
MDAGLTENKVCTHVLSFEKMLAMKIAIKFFTRIIIGTHLLSVTTL